MQKYNIIELNEKQLPDLQAIASELGLSNIGDLEKQALVYRILDEQAIALAGENKKEPKKAEGRKRGRPAKVKTQEPEAESKQSEQPAEAEQELAASEQPKTAAPAKTTKKTQASCGCCQRGRCRIGERAYQRRGAAFGRRDSPRRGEKGERGGAVDYRHGRIPDG